MKSLVLAVAALLTASRAPAPLPTPISTAATASPAPIRRPTAPAPATPKSAPVDQRYWVVLKAADAPARSLAADAGVSIEELRPGQVGGFATPAALERAKAAGLTVISPRPRSSPTSRRRARLSRPRTRPITTYAQTVAGA